MALTDLIEQLDREFTLAIENSIGVVQTLEGPRHVANPCADCGERWTVEQQENGARYWDGKRWLCVACWIANWPSGGAE